MHGAGFRARPAGAADVLAVAELTQQHYGGDLDAWVGRLSAQLDRGERVLVAEAAGTVLGYAKAGHRAPQEPDDPAPAGMWVTGALVAPDHRRGGVARRLLGLLLAELRPAGRPVWSMTDASNEASRGLHEDLGFVEVLRAPRLLGEDFRSGEGVLLRLDPA